MLTSKEKCLRVPAGSLWPSRCQGVILMLRDNNLRTGPVYSCSYSASYVLSHTLINSCKTMLNYTIGQTAVKNKPHYFSGLWKINHFLALSSCWKEAQQHNSPSSCASDFSCFLLDLWDLPVLFIFFFFNLQLWRETVRGEIFICKCFSGSDTSLHPFFWCSIARIYHMFTPQSLGTGKIQGVCRYLVSPNGLNSQCVKYINTNYFWCFIRYNKLIK